MAQLLFNPNYRMCKKIEYIGMRITHGAAFMSASRCLSLSRLPGENRGTPPHQDEVARRAV